MMKNVDRCDRCGKFVEMSQLFVADEDTGESICRACNDKVMEKKTRMETNEIERPGIVSDDHLTYLDTLRESGVTNMYGAGPYLESNFDVNRADARTILLYWMRTFSQRHPRNR
jgi:hypothetical protein